MEPAMKKVRMEDSGDKNARLKPSEVTKSSNIFGPAISHEDSDEGSNAEIDSEDEVEDDFTQDQLDDEDEGTDEEEEDDDEEGEEEGGGGETNGKGKRKRTDPSDFSTAMQKILASNLTKSVRQNPILARSLERKQLDTQDSEAKVLAKLRHRQLLENRARLEKGHVSASSLRPGKSSALDQGGVEEGEEEEEEGGGGAEEGYVRRIEHERGMKKIAQRGVVRLFNAIRAAQLSAGNREAEQGPKTESTQKGINVRQGAGVKKRIDKAQELSKNSFLELIKAGGRTAQ